MKYPDTTPYVATKPGDRRPGSLRGGNPIGVHRSAAQKRAATKLKHAKKIPPVNQYKS